ncbi:MAG: hypothetical protein J1F33_05120 [Clostridiales bacterium]|nr:hypothetical protein [Clostridiales bacterium]
MKVLRVLAFVFCLIGAVLIPIAIFTDVNGKEIIGLFGYFSILVGTVLSFLVGIVVRQKENKIKLNNKTKNKTNIEKE